MKAILSSKGATRLPPGVHWGLVESTEWRGHALVVKYRIGGADSRLVTVPIYAVGACMARTSRGRVCGRVDCRAHHRQRRRRGRRQA